RTPVRSHRNAPCLTASVATLTAPGRSRAKIAAPRRPPLALRHLDPRADAAVEQPLQMVLGERVSRPFPDQGGEGGERARVAGLKPGEGGDIGFGVRARALL